jgi:glycosyltransferase involved in cell wall biosynthesis
MISVLIATYNGADTIQRTLASLRVASAGRSDVEVIVVNNRSTDGTEKLLPRAAQGLRLEVLDEPKPGKNHALNTGLRSCRGDIIAFTDDDVIVNPDWLNALAAVAARCPDLDIFGGPITPMFEDAGAAEALVELPRRLWTVLYALRPRIGPRQVPPDFLFGPNYCVRRRVLDSGLRFDTAVGPDGTELYRMGSETTFLRSCAERGYRAGFLNRLAVQHIVPVAHTRKEWIYARARRYGYGGAYADASNPKVRDQPHDHGIPHDRYDSLVRARIRYKQARQPNDPKKISVERWWLIAYLSYSREYRRLRRAEKRAPHANEGGAVGFGDTLPVSAL